MKTSLFSTFFVLVLMMALPHTSIAQPATDNQGERESMASSSQPFRVMSFNIRWGGAADPPSVWPDRRERVVTTIKAYDPDILGVQEAILSQVKYLRDEMDGYVFFGAGRDDGKLAGEMCAIYYKRDRFLRIGGGHFWLSEETDQPGSFGWDAACPRMVSWLRLRDKTDDGVLFVANTHWDHRGDKSRLNSARMMREHLPELAKEGDAIVILGDFNCDEDDEPYSVLVGSEQEAKSRFIDSYRSAHPDRGDQEATYHGFRGGREGSRIDWILHAPALQTLAAGIDTTHEGLKYPSDHFPVTATLQRAE
jgi:endonuclease/exonuclease/phosphatase family metal-dependent hydrolase